MCVNVSNREVIASVSVRISEMWSVDIKHCYLCYEWVYSILSHNIDFIISQASFENWANQVVSFITGMAKKDKPEYIGECCDKSKSLLLNCCLLVLNLSVILNSLLHRMMMSADMR